MSSEQQTNQSQCPIHQSNNKFNHLNNIPELAQSPSPGQTISLSLERTPSSIPRPLIQENEISESSSCPVLNNHQNNTWVYPSPQQFYNALVRKGWETPQEAIPVMVDIHNWMNEAVWNQVLTWESNYFSSNSMKSIQNDISLAKFQGRPNDLSPKARFNSILSNLFPSLYSPIKPFDRHDWFISRNSHNKLSRYVIDYYNAGEDSNGNPVFHFDVRPAIDDVTSLVARLKEWSRVKSEKWIKLGSSSSESSVSTSDSKKNSSKSIERNTSLFH